MEAKLGTKLLGDVATLQRGFDLPYRLRKPGNVPVVTSSGFEGRHNVPRVKGPGVVTGRYGTIGKVFYIAEDFWPLNTTLYVKDFHGNDPLFISYLLRTVDFHTHSGKSGVPGVNRNDLHALQVLVPDLPEQKNIASTLANIDTLIASLESLINKKYNVRHAVMQQLLTGKMRLQGFTGSWEPKSFDDIFHKIPAKRYQLQTSEYLSGGRFPIIDQGKKLIIAYSDRGDKVFKCPDNGVIVFGDHTCIVKYIDFDFIIGADGVQVLTMQAGQSAYFHALLLWLNPIASTGYNRHFKFLKERVYLCPGLPEQDAIAAILVDFNAELSVLRERLAKIRLLKQGMMQNLLTGKIRLV